MSADLLREAAELMRRRAEKATPGPWANDDDGAYAAADLVEDPRWPGEPVQRSDMMEVAQCYRDERQGERAANAEHIASWHPAVALAVADWLWWEAAGSWNAQAPDAVAVARAYLGRDT